MAFLTRILLWTDYCSSTLFPFSSTFFILFYLIFGRFLFFFAVQIPIVSLSWNFFRSIPIIRRSIQRSTNLLAVLQSIRCRLIAQHSLRNPSLRYSTTELSLGHPSTAQSVPNSPLRTGPFTI
ncbi:hypothetical protein BDV29DRAFT_29408 [Aspergillus leporis]|uniref:Uncharacterized protein n=1 Tax=Aspergillus leporis TaxID=41062 RepID=A0A5N5WU40_9EURO|nr:hypothetical protein BDV29DRAFT_29408 [Aspergillus leporis]